MLSKDDRDAIERQLLRDREEALHALEEFQKENSISLQEEAGEMSVYRFHMADIGTESMQREKQFLLTSKEGERLYRIDEALRRLYGEPESFGRCASCGGEIGLERLRLMPEATLCSACQRDAEA